MSVSERPCHPLGLPVGVFVLTLLLTVTSCSGDPDRADSSPGNRAQTGLPTLLSASTTAAASPDAVGSSTPAPSKSVAGATTGRSQGPGRASKRSASKGSRPSRTSAQASRGFPHAGNTGVPAGTQLRRWKGGRYIRTANVVLSGYLFEGDVVVQADNVTIRNSLVRGGRIDAGYGSEQTGLVVSDTEIDARGIGSGFSMIGDVNYSCIRCDLHGGGSGPRMGGRVVIRDSFIHDLCCADEAHKSGVGSNGGNHLVVQHNTIECDIAGCSAALSLYGPHDDVLIANNLLNTVGGYCSYGGGDSATRVRFVNNVFGRKYNPRCGGYGPVFAFQTRPGNVWRGNVWQGTGREVRP